MTKSTSKNKNMRNAVIRVSAKNTIHEDNKKLGVKAGDIVEYTKEDILNILDDWCRTKPFSYYMAEHNEKEDNVHFHIVIEFKNNSQCKFNTLKSKFPFGHIDSCRFGVHACVRYLIHADNTEKHQYNWSDIITNNVGRLERFKQPSKYSEQIYVNKLVEQICKGEIKEYELTDKIEPNLYVKYHSTFKNAFEFRAKQLLNDPNRNISVYVLQGPCRCGKSTMAKVWAEKHNKSICFSSGSRDIWQDYRQEQVFVLDDFNHEKMPIEDMLKMLDPHVNTTVSARYRNRLFVGDTIFICTNTPIISWYYDENDLTDDALRKALFKRINLVLDFQQYKMKPVYKNGYYRTFDPTTALTNYLSYNNLDTECPLKDGVACYTINKIVELMDIDDEEKANELRTVQVCNNGRTLLSVDDDKVHYFDLKKYIKIDADKSNDDEFIEQISKL